MRARVCYNLSVYILKPIMLRHISIFEKVCLCILLQEIGKFY